MTNITRPNLPTILDRLQSDMEYHLEGANARADESLLNCLAQANTGAIHGLYGYVDYLKQQLLPDTADAEWLLRWAIALGVEQQQASKAKGTVKASGAGLILAFAELQHPVSKLRYSVSTSSSDENAVLTIEALEAGKKYNLKTGDVLEFITPIEGVALEVVAVSVGGGADEESLESWRNRVSKGLAERAKVGDDDDYASWAIASHPAITQAWVYPLEMGLGTVVIRCIAGNNASIILDNQTLEVAQAELDRLRNSAATVFLIAPAANTIDVSIADVCDDDDLKANITEELNLLFKYKRGQSALIRRSEIDAAIQRHTLEYTLVSPVANVQCDNKQVFVLGEVLWLA